MQVDNIRKFAVLFFAAISFCLAIFCFVNAFRFILPWEYTWFTPLSFLSEHAAGTVFILLSAALIALVSVFAGIEGKKAGKDWLDTLFVMSAALFLGYAGGEVLVMGNYGVISALCIVLLITALSTGHDILAGFAWAFLKTKPQTGALFAIPILLKRRFITAGVAAGPCLISTIPPTLMCGKSPLEMIPDVPRGCSFITEENGTMIIPSKVYGMLSGKVPFALPNGINMAIGTAIRLALTKERET